MASSNTVTRDSVSSSAFSRTRDAISTQVPTTESPATAVTTDNIKVTRSTVGGDQNNAPERTTNNSDSALSNDWSHLVIIVIILSGTVAIIVVVLILALCFVVNKYNKYKNNINSDEARAGSGVVSEINLADLLKEKDGVKMNANSINEKKIGIKRIKSNSGVSDRVDHVPGILKGLFDDLNIEGQPANPNNVELNLDGDDDNDSDEDEDELLYVNNNNDTDESKCVETLTMEAVEGDGNGTNVTKKLKSINDELLHRDNKLGSVGKNISKAVNVVVKRDPKNTGGPNEKNYLQWNQRDVLIWIKMHLVNNGIDHNIIKSFLTQLSKKCVTGVVIGKMKQEPLLMNELKLQFIDDCYWGVWVIIQSAIASIDDDKKKYTD